MKQAGTKVLNLMGTFIEMYVRHPEYEALLSLAESRLHDYEKRFSAHNSQSRLGRLQQMAGIAAVRVEQDLFELIKIGKYYSQKPDLFLNIAIGPLTRLWHIGFDDQKRPTQKEIDHILPLIDPSAIILDEQQSSVYLSKEKMSLDLGAIAKGYFADLIMQEWKQAGVTAAYINLGGNVLVDGPALHAKDFNWRVGLQNPFKPRGNTLLTLKIHNQSVVTSGIYERNYQLGQKNYHHIFNSQTGYPVDSEIVSITVIANQSLTCELWTTLLFGLSAKEAIAQLNQLSAVEGIVITKDQKIFYTANLTRYIAE